MMNQRQMGGQQLRLRESGQRKLAAIACAGAGIVGLCAQASMAASYSWNNASGGTWETAANWLPSTSYPMDGTSNADTALFTNLTFTGSIPISINSSTDGANDVEFAGSANYTFSGTNKFRLGTPTASPGAANTIAAVINDTGSGAETVSIPLVLNNAVSTATITNNSSGTLTFSGQIQPVGTTATAPFSTQRVAVAGSGNTVISIANSGSTIFSLPSNFANVGLTENSTNGGTLTISGDLGAAINQGLTVTAGTVRMLNTAATYTGGTTVAANANLLLGNGTLGGTTSGAIANAGVVDFNPSTANQQFTFAISGAGEVIKDGSSREYLSGSDSYTGGTIVNGGPLDISDPSNLGTGSITFTNGNPTITASAPTLRFRTPASGSSITLANSVLLNGPATVNFVNSGITAALSGNISGVGALVAGGGVNAVSGVTGTLTLLGGNAYSGGTTINSGTVLINNTSGSGTGSGSVTLAGAGAILGGTGTISGGVNVIANTTLIAGIGSAAATLTTGGVNFTGGTFSTAINSNTLTNDPAGQHGFGHARRSRAVERDRCRQHETLVGDVRYCQRCRRRERHVLGFER